ncbi:L-fuconate dehydratase [Elongatibacter sediminis]|uniref:L-fuconate dehydratase n=1 Tax=Elongatibacter sediminis TaxID=3119006 RepID=A0AAW9RI21_9GAMM
MTSGQHPDGVRITGHTIRDIRFPTSDELHGSDAMNNDPDYSCAYITLLTDRPELTGHGLVFTIGRGNEICCAALESIADAVIGRTLSSITDDFAAFSRELTGDAQMRWLGPEKGVVHMAAGALINAVWDLYARLARKPLWLLLSELSPEELVRCVDFNYLTDALTPDEALKLLESMTPGRKERIEQLRNNGFPGYTTSAGWLGYSDERIRTLCREAVTQGWTHLKMKVGVSLEDDCRRAAIIREEIGPDRFLMMDANQAWDVDEAIDNMRVLADFDPHWIEEPTSPDDVLGHAAIARAIKPIRVASGEHCQNRIIFKQLMSIGAIDVCQIDSCRVAGVNENLAILLLARKFDIPVCPHAGGVGLCEQVQHLAMFDYIALSGTTDGRLIEYVDHLHEHFTDPVRIRQGHYLAPSRPGYSIEMKPESLATYEFPDGPVWKQRLARTA